MISATAWSLEHWQARSYGGLGFTFSVLYQYILGNITALRVFYYPAKRSAKDAFKHGCSCSIALRLTLYMHTKPQPPRPRPRAMPSPDQENNTAHSTQLAHLETLFYQPDI